MSAKVVRDIINIDEEKCDGCGACVLSCAEGAIRIIEGKARLIREDYCDGLGACIGECPQGALTIEKRESQAFDEKAVEEHLAATVSEESLPCGCPGSSVQQFERPIGLPMLAQHPCSGHDHSTRQEPALSHWPVQLTLVPPNAPFLQGVDLLLAAHCGPFAYADFHRDLIKDHSVVCACPKLDNARAHQEKLTEVLKQSDIKSVTVVRMEVPCCGGLTCLAQQAVADSGKQIPIKEVVIGIKGEIQSIPGIDIKETVKQGSA